MTYQYATTTLERTIGWCPMDISNLLDELAGKLSDDGSSPKDYLFVFIDDAGNLATATIGCPDGSPSIQVGMSIPLSKERLVRTGDRMYERVPEPELASKQERLEEFVRGNYRFSETVSNGLQDYPGKDPFFILPKKQAGKYMPMLWSLGGVSKAYDLNRSIQDWNLIAFRESQRQAIAKTPREEIAYHRR